MPGKTGEPLDDDEIVFRLADRPSGYGKSTFHAGANTFRLTEDDLKYPLKSISVWVARLTDAAHVLAFRTPQRMVEPCLVLSAKTSAIRQFYAVSEEIEWKDLDVVWDPLFIEENEQKVPDMRPGASGHAGITGLEQRKGIPNAKNIYKDLREEFVRLFDHKELNV